MMLQVRVWNIPEQRVVDWADVHEMVTATAFSPDGRRAVVGTMKGRCRFYQCEPTFKLEYQAQIGALSQCTSLGLPVRLRGNRRCMPQAQHRSGQPQQACDVPLKSCEVEAHWCTLSTEAVAYVTLMLRLVRNAGRGAH